MTGLTATLIIVGIIFVIGSFFVTEKMSVGEVDKMAKVNMTEINQVMDREIKGAIERGKDDLAMGIEEVILDSERSMEKMSNEKIMAISDYSDTVLEAMEKSHNEIMFLYSMLNDKHKELTDFANEIGNLQAKLVRTMDSIEKEQADAEMRAVFDMQPKMPEVQEIILESLQKEENLDNTNHNDRILELYNRGKDEIEIAKELGLGFGEVKLVIELYKEKED